jgi:SAM-dependent methyltransferase
MGCCSHCKGIETEFGERTARRELRGFRRKGPRRTTRILLDALRREGIGGATLLDVGGGVGAIHHELLDDGVRAAVHVDAASAYIAAARGEAQRRRHDDRVEFLEGDFVDLAPQVPEADIVTLDRVICCYPDVEGLVRASSGKALRLYGVVYPRPSWWLRLVLPLPNLYFRLRRSPFRVFLHPVEKVDEEVRNRGLELVDRCPTLVWEVALYRRVRPVGSGDPALAGGPALS